MSNISLKQVLPSTVPTPAANYVRIFSNLSDSGSLYIKNSSGSSETIGGTTEPSVTAVTYTALYNLQTGAQFVTGSHYLITDFETRYRQPDYYCDGSTKPTLAYKSKPSGWGYQPILVMAISSNALSPDAYQPNITSGAYAGFHKDKIKYDLLDNSTEFNDVTRGRITSRIDEYGNQTDYDHRTIQFKRYMNYSKDSLLSGTITDYNCVSGLVTGSSTLFSSELSVGDIIILDSKSDLGYDVGLKVSSITSNTSINVVVDSLYSGGVPSSVNLLNLTSITPVNYTFSGKNYTFWLSTSTGDYLQYKEVYFGQSDSNDYDEFYTFSTGSFDNKISDFSYHYTEGHSGYLLLPNNVFVSSSCRNNFQGQTFNNTFNVATDNICFGDFWNNTIASFISNLTNGFYENQMGQVTSNRFYGSFHNNFQPLSDYFSNNTINADDVENIDFSGATRVTAHYNCEIFKNSADVVKLSYYNGSNVLTIDDANS